MERETRAFAAACLWAATALLVFGWLANEALAGQPVWFDAAIRNAIHARSFPLLTAFMWGLTQLGSAPFVIAMGALAVWELQVAQRRRAALLLVIAVAGSEALDQILKVIFHRARPEPFFGFAPPVTYSFPSGHALTSACFYGSLAAIIAVRTRPRALRAALWCAAALLAGGIGLSRIYLGVHYPTDVAAGYAAAVIWVSAIGAGDALRRRRDARRAATGLRASSPPETEPPLSPC